MGLEIKLNKAKKRAKMFAIKIDLKVKLNNRLNMEKNSY